MAVPSDDVMRDLGRWIFDQAKEGKTADELKVRSNVSWEVSSLMKETPSLMNDLFIDLALYCEYRIASRRGESNNVVGCEAAVIEDLRKLTSDR